MRGILLPLTRRERERERERAERCRKEEGKKKRWRVEKKQVCERCIESKKSPSVFSIEH